MTCPTFYPDSHTLASKEKTAVVNVHCGFFVAEIIGSSFGYSLRAHQVAQITVVAEQALRNFNFLSLSNKGCFFFEKQKPIFEIRSVIMLQANEIQKRFNNIEQSIRQASQACQSSQNVPEELKNCIQQLDSQSSNAKQVLQSQDEQRIRQCVDDLEQLGDRAKDVCQQSQSVDSKLKQAVMQAHDGLSDLKRQLH